MTRHLVGLIYGLLLLGIIPDLCAQSYQINNNIPVYGTDGRQWQHPWTGGVNHPKYNSIDLNHNGKPDLIVSDFQSTNDQITFKPFINIGGCDEIEYEFAPQYEHWFDSCDCKSWVLFKDYNQDGIEDIFCGAGVGQNYRVYRSIRHANDSLSFELAYDRLTYYDAVDNPRINYPIYVVRTDVPGIADIDGDGDIDIITSSNSSLSYSWYRNRGVEDFGRADTIVMEFNTFCWGKFGINTRAVFIPSSGITCFRDARGNPTGPRHEGSSLFPIDHNGDGLMDILVGDVDHNKATMAINSGIDTLAFMKSAIENYPNTDSAIDMIIFPTFYYVDVNNDSTKDLIISTNPPGLPSTPFENIYGTALYLNEGKNDSLDLRFQDRSFFVSDHIDVGRFSYPGFIDYNDDGLEDLFVGSGTSFERFGNEMRETYNFLVLENTGTATQPAFTLKNRYFLNLGQGSPPISNASPTGGDLDNDGDMDLLLGNTAGNIFYLENISPVGTAANYVAAVNPTLQDDQGNEIRPSFNSAPELADFDGDGDLDLWVGSFTGKISFYENVGTAGTPIFQFKTDFFGAIDLENELNQTDGHSKPRVIDWDGDGFLDLVLGGRAGEVMLYSDIRTGLTSALKPTARLIEADYAYYSTPAVADLFGTGQPALVSGHQWGGLMLYNAAPLVVTEPDSCVEDIVSNTPSLPQKNGWKVFPNPTSGQLNLQYEADLAGPTKLTLINHMGQVVANEQTQSNTFAWEIAHLSPGIYHLRIESDEEIFVEKIILRPR